MRPSLRTKEPPSLSRMWGLLSDLWLAVDALVEPGGTWMGDFPGKVTDDPAGRDTQDEQGMLRQVRDGFTMLLRATVSG